MSTPENIRIAETFPLLSVVVPVYEEEANISPFLKRLIPVMEKITSEYEVIFSMDHSTDGTEKTIVEHLEQNPKIKLLRFSRRFGQAMATLAGLHYSSGEAVVVIDVDLQDPPELIEVMVKKWREGYDVVMAQRSSRVGETWLKRLVSFLGYQVINRIADVKIPPNTGDFRLMSRRVVRELVRLKEVNGFLRGLAAVVGFQQVCIPFDRDARFTGKGNYNRFLGSLRIGLNGIIGFSTFPLTLSTLFGFLVAGFSFFIALAYLILKIWGLPFPMGNPTIVIIVLFLGGVQLISVGILGEYIGRIYEEVKQRPKFIVEKTWGTFKNPIDSVKES